MRTLLLILDGMGMGPEPTRSAVVPESMPFLFSLMESRGHSRLEASGPAVGLDEGQVGNSEVGHLTIGAGRRLASMAERIGNAYRDGSWARSPIWEACKGDKVLHLIGLLSDAGVHGHYRNLTYAATMAWVARVPEVWVHPVLDGVDSQAGTAPRLLRESNRGLADLTTVKLGTVMGRRWACDRSGDLDISRFMVDRLEGKVPSPEFNSEALEAHLRGSSEADFPSHLFHGGRYIREGESVLFCNHRADRTVQLAKAFSERHKVYSLVELKDTVPMERVFFPILPLDQGLGHILAKEGIPSLRIAEKCKFPHVTFFLNGFNTSLGEEAICIPSIPEAEIRANPAMSTTEITRTLIEKMRSGDYTFIAVNIANLDQVGHLGDLALARKAASVTDGALREIVAACREGGWNLVITSDHGNADEMIDASGKPLGSHTGNDVPLVVLAADGRSVRAEARASLANVAPTVLSLMGIPAPEGMAESLLPSEAISAA